MFNLSLASLIIANLIPLCGVLFFGWSLFTIVFLYWLENGIIGFFNLFKMAKAEGLDMGKLEVDANALWKILRPFPMLFFLVHFGIFTLVQGIFVFAVFGPADISLADTALFLIGAILSHAVSFRTNYLGRNEYKRVSPFGLMTAPYRRVLVMQATILAGGFLAQSFGESRWAIAVMVLAKIFLDQYFHRQEHGLFPSALEAAGAHTDEVVFESRSAIPQAFREQFARCEPGAKMTSPEIFGNIAAYKIIGPKNGRCELRMTFIKCPNPAWAGKDLTCLYDQTKIFDEAVKEFTEAVSGNNAKMLCQGPLFDAMRGGSEKAA